MLRFSEQNAKTANLKSVPALSKYLPKGKKIYSLDLLSGFSCPGANECKSMTVMGQDGKCHIVDGPDCQFRCFSASQEVQYPALRALRSGNFEQIKACGNDVNAIARLILGSLPNDAGIVRYHVGGDFFSLAYMKAARLVAIARPDVLFYGYTKSLNHLQVMYCADLCQDLAVGKICENFLITASIGGKYDNLAPQFGVLGVRSASVIFAESEAGNLPIDHTDEHAATPGGNFVLLLHGTQKAGSEAAKAWSAIKKSSGGYSRK